MSSSKNKSAKKISSKKSSFMSGFLSPSGKENPQSRPDTTNYDDENDEEEEVTAPDGKGKIKFKKKRKRPKMQLMSVYKDMTHKSRFDDWTVEQMSQVLVAEGIQIGRDLWKQELLDLCEALFAGRPMPEQPRAYTLRETIILRRAAIRIQRAYRHRKERRLLHLEDDLMEKKHSMLMKFEEANEIGFGRDELMYIVSQLDMEEVNMSSVSAKKQGGVSAAVSSGKVSILDMEYRHPRVDKAEQYAHQYMARRDARKGQPYDFHRMTTGRHCSASRNGEETCAILTAEQFDLFEEGSMSELEKYGLGLVNYFKFMKWCIWLFLILAVLSAPSVAFNTNGANSPFNTGFNELARTTFGNLLPNSTQDTVHIPGCFGYEELHMHCFLTRYTLAKFFTGMDVFICLTILIAVLWLRAFERHDEIVLKDAKYDASMYTVVFANLPHSIKHYESLELDLEGESTKLGDEEKVEGVIKDHLKKVLKRDRVHVSDVIVAFNNEEEIRLSRERGDLIKEKTRLVNMFRAARSDKDTEAQSDFKMHALKTSCFRIDKRLGQIKEEFEVVAKKPLQVLQAYVTFRSLEDRKEVLKIYNQLPLLVRLCGYNRSHLKIKNKMPQVYAASDPGVILWENLHFTAMNRIWRRFWSTLLACSWIVVSLVIVFGVKYVQEKSRETDSKSDDDAAAVYCCIASFIVIMMNVMIELTLRRLHNYEKHHSEDNRDRSLIQRLFFLQFCNTSIIFLFDNSANLLHVFGIVVPGGRLDFTADWFNTMGVTIIIVNLTNVFFTHTYKAVQYYHFVRRKRKLSKHCDEILTQTELNAAFVGPHLDFAANYGQMLCTIFSCLVFSTGIPVLYSITAGYFYVYYLVEKYLFVHMYRVPTNFKVSVGWRVTEWIPLAVVIHLWTALWMLTNTQLFVNPPLNQGTNNQNIPDDKFSRLVHNKVTGKIGVPFFCLFIIWIFFRVLQFFVKKFHSEIDVWCRFNCPSWFIEPIIKEKHTKPYIYEEAKLSGKIRGLTSYNILQNPKYREAFAITDDFAARHRNVRTVRNTNGESQYIKPPTSPDKPATPRAKTVTLVDNSTSEQYSASLQYNPYSSPPPQTNGRQGGGAHQTPPQNGGSGSRNSYPTSYNNTDPYGYNDYSGSGGRGGEYDYGSSTAYSYGQGHAYNQGHGYDQQQQRGWDQRGYDQRGYDQRNGYGARSHDEYDRGYGQPAAGGQHRAVAHSDSYYARQLDEEWNQGGGGGGGGRGGSNGYGYTNTTSNAYSRPKAGNAAAAGRHDYASLQTRSVDRTPRGANDSFLMTDYNPADFDRPAAPVQQQPGPPKKQVQVTVPRESTTQPTAVAKKPSAKNVKRRTSNLGFHKSFYDSGDASFYEVDAHED